MNIVLITLHYNSNVKPVSGLVTIFKPFTRLVIILKVWKNTCVTNVYIFNYTLIKSILGKSIDNYTTLKVKYKLW